MKVKDVRKRVNEIAREIIELDSLYNVDFSIVQRCMRMHRYDEAIEHLLKCIRHEITMRKKITERR